MSLHVARIVGVLAAVGTVFFASPVHGQTGTWATRAPMPTARMYTAAGVVNDVLYVTGGYFTFKTVEAYDPSTDAWSTRAQMPTDGDDIADDVDNCPADANADQAKPGTAIPLVWRTGRSMW